MLTRPRHDSWFLTTDLRPDRSHPLIAGAILAGAPRISGGQIYIGAGADSLSYNGVTPYPQSVIMPSGMSFRNVTGGSGGWNIVNPLNGSGLTVREYSVGIFASGYYDGTRGRLIDQGGVGSANYCLGISFSPAGVFQGYTAGSGTSSVVTTSIPYQDLAPGLAAVLAMGSDKKARMYVRGRGGRADYAVATAQSGTPTNLATAANFTLLCNQDSPAQPNVWGGVSHFVVWPFDIGDDRAWQFVNNPLGNFVGPRDLRRSGIAVASGGGARSRGLIIQ